MNSDANVIVSLWLTWLVPHPNANSIPNPNMIVRYNYRHFNSSVTEKEGDLGDASKAENSSFVENNEVTLC